MAFRQVYLEKDVYPKVVLEKLSASLTHPFKCTECQQRFHKVYEATAHYLTSHQNSNKIKRDVSPDGNHVSQDENYLSPYGNYVSPYGNCVSPKRNYVPWERKTIKKNPKCQICLKTFRDNWKLKRHEKVHLKKNSKCQICLKTFQDNGKLKRHEKAHLNIDYVPAIRTSTYGGVCPKCGEFHKMLNKHIQTKHPLEKLFKCEQCKCALATKSGLKQHIVNSHPKDEDMKICQVCGASFVSKGNLKQHMEAVHEKKRDFTCNICDSKFYFKHKMRGNLLNGIDNKTVRRWKISICFLVTHSS